MKQAINWVTLKSFSTPIEAHVVRGHLESEGILCYLRDEHTIGMNWLYSNLLGGVRLCVPAEELGRAQELLRFEAEPSRPAGLACPHCGSTHVNDADKRRRWSMFSLLALNLPLPFRKLRYQCETCGHQFRMRA
ncbi:MAG: DUF2007 domain-containing protein [Proteobacteria bacterium]|nr:MAG: DUF2007 domain-containing protein [Pseudomonadota bacterium]